jgi:hypothetical protein
MGASENGEQNRPSLRLHDAVPPQHPEQEAEVHG